MLTLASAGLKPCETTDGSNSNGANCSLCPNTADGYDATLDAPICTTCAETHTVDEGIVEGHDD